MIEGAEEYLGPPAQVPGIKSPENNGNRPSVRAAIVRHMRENGNRGWGISTLADELWKRKWLGGDNKPSRSTLRQALDNLREQGVVVAEKQGDDRWAPNIWKLSNKTLARSPDLS